jgi:hypothetical protein
MRQPHGPRVNEVCLYSWPTTPVAIPKAKLRCHDFDRDLQVLISPDVPHLLADLYNEAKELETWVGRLLRRKWDPRLG